MFCTFSSSSSVPHTWSTLPLRVSPSCHLHRHCTVKEVSSATTSSSSSTNHHRCFAAAFVLLTLSRGRCTAIAPSRSRYIFFFFDQPSPMSTTSFRSVRLHRRCTAAAPHHRGGCFGAAAIASVQSRSFVWVL
ncbi:hypothetical protein DEO72_LG9g1198 [Vigna unguiculata]|uniref:Uncharacterized protein n=1 Tax=Vigna unguiculata TaxID=3917 RepID=A0A4D6N2G6_VIGUN|nr:hypothetical protein DEO72_LG9g1198 [Vigna unguiculata]